MHQWEDVCSTLIYLGTVKHVIFDGREKLISPKQRLHEKQPSDMGKSIYDEVEILLDFADYKRQGKKLLTDEISTDFADNIHKEGN